VGATSARVPLARLEHVIYARHLSFLEQERLKGLLVTGLSIREIAATMRWAPSTITRELRRKTVSRSGHRPHTAHAPARTPSGCVTRRRCAAAKLKKRWSPEQICHRLQRVFPMASGCK